MGTADIIVFTDGGSKGNPGPGGWGAVVVTPDGQVTELGGGRSPTTNNQMELTGAIEALVRLEHTGGTLTIYTDSTYVIKGITQWIWGWRQRGWKTAAGDEVLNRDLWERLARLVTARGKGQTDWRYVRGHTGIAGNERVDEIATAFALGRDIVLYTGPLTTYPRPILDVPNATGVPTRSAGASSRDRVKPKTGAFSYLSVVDGTPMRHRTWPECERRVIGQSGARFKKAATQADEAVILRDWGFEPSDL